MPVSRVAPENESTRGALEFTEWGLIGSEILVKSNINNWIACTPGSGSLVTWTPGTLNCRLIKSITTNCPDLPAGKFFSKLVIHYF